MTKAAMAVFGWLNQGICERPACLKSPFKSPKGSWKIDLQVMAVTISEKSHGSKRHTIITPLRRLPAPDRYRATARPRDTSRKTEAVNRTLLFLKQVQKSESWSNSV
jgi:hypothetical protein